MGLLPPMLQCDSTVLLVVDVQDRLLPAIHEGPTVVAGCLKMVQAAKVLGLPVLATEQYPAGLGRTCGELAEALPAEPVIEKTRFSGCVEPVLQRLGQLKPVAVVVVGIEAHVCVQQTVLDLLRSGFRAYLCVDAVGSRRPLDRDTAILRMGAAGAVVTTTESVIFELAGEAGTERFKAILKIVK